MVRVTLEFEEEGRTFGQEGWRCEGVWSQGYLCEMTHTAGRGPLLPCLEALGIWNKTDSYKLRITPSCLAPATFCVSGTRGGARSSFTGKRDCEEHAYAYTSVNPKAWTECDL